MAITNREIGRILRSHADLLEISGGNRYRINAFRRAGNAVRSFEGALADEPDPTVVPNVGAGLAPVISEIVTTGSFVEHDELLAELPGSLPALFEIPGLGAKRIKRFYDELSITSIDDLEAAAASGRLSTLKGVGAKAETQILEGIAFLRRRTGRASIGIGLPLAERLAADLGGLIDGPVFVVGSVRRMAETIGNIDLLAISEHPATVFGAVETLSDVAARTVGSDEASWSTFELQQGIDLRVFVGTAAEAGRLQILTTGSAAHIEALGGADAIPMAETEAACYAELGMEWIPPELREGRDELELAREGRLPKLIELDDIRGDLHLHSTWSDGAASILEMAQAGRQRGYEFMAICDHSGGLAIANGLNAQRLQEQRQEIDSLANDAPLRLLAGSEVEVHRDGKLDFDDDVLAGLDLVVASLHSGIRQDQETITDRICRTLANRNVDIVAHPTGRLIERRPGASYDWPRVIDAAVSSGTALEINADPSRLDMREEHARMAAEAGALIAIDSDAHHPDGLSNMRYGVGIARRAGIEAHQVVNTWPLDDLLAWLQDRQLSS